MACGRETCILPGEYLTPTSSSLTCRYPTGLALAASFDPELVFDVAAQTAIEVRGNTNSETAGGAAFGASCFGPVSNLIRDSRWGRTAEMITGEDPTLGRIMSAAFTAGIQHRPAAPAPTHDDGENSPPAKQYRMVNTIAKHLNTYAGPEGHGFTFGPDAERFQFEAKLTEREWREFFLPPYKGSADAGVSGFMCSYSAITFTDHPERSHNTPACANDYLLNQVVRKNWGWDGYVLSDAGAVAFIGNTSLSNATSWSKECPECHWGHGYAANHSDAAAKALENGMDIELTCCGAPAVFPTLPASVASGRIAEELLDRSLRRTLPVRFDLGHLDPAADQKRNPFNKLDANNVSTPAMIALALKAAQRTVVMLKNDAAPGANAPLLPLSPEKMNGKGICVIGPNANNTRNLIGDYVNRNPRFITTIYQGVVDTFVPSGSAVHLHNACSSTACTDLDPGAVALARSNACDVIILALGLTADARAMNGIEGGQNACGCPEGDAVEGECCDRKDVKLPGQQQKLLEDVAGIAGKPTIVVSVNAGMLDLSFALESPNIASVIISIYQGMTTGTAIATTIAGESNPAGRLPISYYRNISETGTLEDYNMHSRTYRYSSAEVVRPFGFGLGYVSLSLSTN